MLCKYKDIFGKPGTGAHAYRAFDIALVDTLVTFFIAVIIAYRFKFSIIWTFIVLFIMGEIMHLIFCVDTTIIKWFKSLIPKYTYSEASLSS